MPANTAVALFICTDHVTAEDKHLHILCGCSLPKAQLRDETVSKKIFGRISSEEVWSIL